MNKTDIINAFRERFNTDIVKYDDDSPVIQWLLTTLTEFEREVEGDIYNNLVNISDDTHGILNMVDVAKYILVERRKDDKKS